MENAVLKKRLNTFKSGKGQLRDVSDEVVMEVLRAWEAWPGPSADLCREIEITRSQMATMIQKAKRLVKSGVIAEPEFKEIKIAGADERAGAGHLSSGPIELCWSEGRVIRFGGVDLLVEFLKKAA